MTRTVKSGVRSNDDDSSVWLTQNKYLKCGKGKGSKGATSKTKTNLSSATVAGPSLNLIDESNPLTCNGCTKPVTEVGLCCDKCDLWYHLDCAGLTKTEYNAIDKNSKIKGIKWFCDNCLKLEAGSIIEPAVSIAKQNLQIDVLIKLVESLQQQNSVILELLTKEKKKDEQVKIQLTEAIIDQREREEKKDNIIFFNLEEGEGKNEADDLLSDTEKVKQILKVVSPEVEVEDLIASEVGRLGGRRKGTDTKPRPVRVTLKPGTRSHILKNANKLKNSTHNKVGLSPDRTRSELAEFRAKRAEFVKRRDDGEEVVWFKGEIVLRADLNKPSDPISKGGSGSTDQDDQGGN